MSYLQPEGLMRGTHMMTPIHTNRFFFTIDNDPTTKMLCKTAQRPTVNMTDIAIPHVNKTRYVKGKHTFEPLNITLHDYITPSVSQLCWEWLQMHNETFTGRDGYEAFYRRTCELEIVGGPGDVVSKYQYLNCFITNLTLGEFTWDGDEVQTIQMTIRYDDVLMLY